jgi:hypothetical protein
MAHQQKPSATDALAAIAASLLDTCGSLQASKPWIGCSIQHREGRNFTGRCRVFGQRNNKRHPGFLDLRACN